MSYTSGNRLATYNGQSVSYDADGNMPIGPLAGQMTSYVYDSRNRLTSAGSLSYQYDAENNRISVTDSVYKTQTGYVINPNAPLSQVLIQTDDQGKQTFHVYGLGLSGQENNGAYTTYHFDLRGSTVALTDNSGNITDRFQYAPYGELVKHTGSTSTPFLYTGKHGVMHDGNGLYYMRARYYNPEIRRFVNQDSLLGQITESQSQNRYIYCQGNPVNYVDPTGHFLTEDFDPEYGHFIYDDQTYQAIKYCTEQWERADAEDDECGKKYWHEVADFYRGKGPHPDEIQRVPILDDPSFILFSTFTGSGEVRLAGKATAYISKNAESVVQYVGITNNLARRAAEQLSSKGIRIEALMGGLSRSDARAVEQALIEIHVLEKKGGTLMNKINSIAKLNPSYAQQLERGYELLKSIGYTE